MKKVFLATILLVAMGINLSAQQAYTKEQTSALVYFMPRTLVHVDVTYTKTQKTPGVFKQYAQRYLGATKAFIENESTVFEVQDVAFRSSTIADTTRAYTINIMGPKVPSVTLSPEGLLLAINAKPLCQKSTYQAPKDVISSAASSVMPLLEEQLIANTEGRMAEGAARMIYSLRENRINILAGEVANTPADGQALATMLNEIEKQEQALVALFMGTTTVDTLHITYCFDPATVKKGVFFRFSQHLGPVAADDLSGEPYTLTIEKSEMDYLPTGEEEKPVKGLSSVYYNLPGHAHITLSHQQEKVAEIRMPVAQWGVSVPLSTQVLNASSIVFNPCTGAIVSIGN